MAKEKRLNMTQAIILAAGMGKRLGINYPKCLSKINNKTLLERCLTCLKKKNITDIIIVTGYKANILIKSVIEEDVNVSYICNDKYLTTNNCVSLLKALPLIENDFFIIESDVIFEPDILTKLKEDKHRINWAVDKFNKDMNGSALTINRDKRITKIKYLTEFSPNKFKSVGILYVSGEYRNTLRKWLENRPDDNLYYDQVIALNLAECPIYAKDISGSKWFEIDTPEELKKAKELFNGL